MLAKPRAQVKGAFGPIAGHATTLGTFVPALIESYGDRAIAHVYPMSLGEDGFWSISTT